MATVVEILILRVDWMRKAEKCADMWCQSTVLSNCDRYCQGHKLEYQIPDERTETQEESLAHSLLNYIKDDHQAEEQDLVETFCRDIDSFNMAFKVSQEEYA